MESKDDIVLHSADGFVHMRKAGKLAAEVLDYISGFVKIGVSTNELNSLCHDMIISRGAIPAPLNYRGFPKSICTSVNHVVCHGIPGDKILSNGDIINIDVTVILDGWHGDTSRMFFVGEPSIKAKRLVKCTYDCMMMAIEKIKPGLLLNEIGRIIEEYAVSNGFSVVRDYCGHGIGRVFHAPPNVVHYYDPSNKIILKPGMFFTIEPMINEGKPETKLLSDKWTVVTRDRSLSAQFEHTLGVTDSGFEIFTESYIR
jgi:methionyl aminopeptidase